MDLPTGKAIHFAGLTHDAIGIGANGIHCHLNHSVTHHDLTQYHPAAATMPAAAKQTIIDAHHHTVTVHTHTLIQPHRICMSILSHNYTNYSHSCLQRNHHQPHERHPTIPLHVWKLLWLL